MNPTNSFRNLYKQLPQKTREVLAFEGFGDFIEEITKDNNFSRQQNDQLIRLTTHVIVGVEDKVNFSKKIAETLVIDPNVANTLSKEINQKIIDNIDDLYDKKEGIEGNFDNPSINTVNLKKIRTSKNSLKIDDLVDNLKGLKLNKEIESIIEFTKNIPEEIRKIIISTEWLKRVKELRAKYSLTEEQTAALIIEILLIIAEITSPEDLAQNIENEADVSQILAEQLAEEVGERIFSWIHKLYTEKDPQHSPTLSLTQQPVNTLDIPPSNLPGEVIGDEESGSIPSPEPLFAKTQQRPLRDTVADFFAKPETTEAPLVEPTPAPKPEPTTPPSFISKKLSQPSTAPTQPRTPQSYTVDPYREPLN